MKTAEINTAVKMLETLNSATQKRVVEHLQEYISALHDEVLWDEKIDKSKDQLAMAARQARAEYKAGHAKPLDIDQF
ncbi:MAG: hypothetical protein JXB24_14550 [Bacteroidales bacterium]|nr:hypothetical protein [Bacteroidales bacterium]